MTDKVYNHRDEKIIEFINKNRDDIDRILKSNFDFYRSERKANLIHYLQLAAIAVSPVVAIVLISGIMYALVK